MQDQEKCTCDKDHIHETYSQGFADGVSSQPQNPEIEKIDDANEIVNHFFQKCGAIIGKEDYDFVVEKLSQAKEVGYREGKNEKDFWKESDSERNENGFEAGVKEERQRIIGILEKEMKGIWQGDTFYCSKKEIVFNNELKSIIKLIGE